MSLRSGVALVAVFALLVPLGARGLTLSRPLSYGDHGADVRELQVFLGKQGFFSYPDFTTYFGRVTKAAVVDFQRAYGIDPIGIVGPLTRARIQAVLSAYSADASPGARSVSALPSSAGAAPVSATHDDMKPWWYPTWTPGPGFTPGYGGGGSSQSSGSSGSTADTTAPVLSGVPSTQTAEATSSSGATVSFSSPTATDAVDPSPVVSCSPASGATFSIGTTTVTCTATDSASNSSSGSFLVVVRDTTAPSISGTPVDQFSEATSAAGATVSFSSPTATDAVDTSPVVSCSPASGTTFAIGSTTVTCTATDSASNSATSTFAVGVRDTTAPSISLTAPADGATASTSAVTVSASGSDAVGIAGVSFKLDGATIGSEDTTAPYSITWDSTTATAGSHSIVAVARDAAGNLASSTASTVTVVLYPPFASDLAVFFDAGQSTMNTSSGLVNSITDLTSLGVNATSTGSLRPTLVSYGSHAGLRFSNGQELMASTTWTMNRQNSALFVVTRTQLGGTGGLSTYALTYMPQSGGTNQLASYFNGNTFSGYDSGAKSSGFIHGHGIETNYMVLSTTSAKLGVGPQETSLAAFPSGTVSGGKIGRWDGTSFPLDQTDILAIVAYNRALFGSEITSVRDWLATRYGSLPRTADTAIVFEGDSLTYGVDSSDNMTMSYPAQLSRLSSTPPKIWNGGSGGDTALNNNAAASTKTILTGVSGYANRLVVYWLGTNDISNGRTAVQLEGDIASYIAAVRAHDAGAVIFGNTIIARDPFNSTQDAEIAEVNAWIKTTADFDHVVDLAADSRLSDATNATYFYSGGIHLTDTGYGVVAALVRAAINAAGYSI